VLAAQRQAPPQRRERPAAGDHRAHVCVTPIPLVARSALMDSGDGGSHCRQLKVPALPRQNQAHVLTSDMSQNKALLPTEGQA
jgi:hypothetical protein